MYPTNNDYEKIINALIATGPCMLLFRGPSGSGKSSLAATIVQNMPGRSVNTYEADDFFMVGGKYIFRFDLLAYAHSLCLSRIAQQYHRHGSLPHWSIIANTGLNRGPSGYEKIAELFGHKVLYYKMPALVAYENAMQNNDIDEQRDILAALSMKNVHGVPDEAIKNQCNKLLDADKKMGSTIAYI